MACEKCELRELVSPTHPRTYMCVKVARSLTWPKKNKRASCLAWLSMEILHCIACFAEKAAHW